MRAARVLDMLMILQRRGRSTAGYLAKELEVTTRTILRDVEALSEAGVPIYTTQGPQGGIELLDGFQTNLTGLTVDEASSLFLVGQPRIAHRLGVGAPVRATREKLLAALAEPLAAEAMAIDDWFLHDPDPAEGNRIPHGELRRISGAIRRRRAIEIAIDHEPLEVVLPLGLILHAGCWQLAHLVNDAPVLRTIDALTSTRLINRTFVRPPDFDLRHFWRSR